MPANMKKILILSILVIVVSFSLTMFVLSMFDEPKDTQTVQSLEESQTIQKSSLIQTDDPNARKILMQCNIDKHCYVEALWDLAEQAQDDDIVFGAVEEIMSNVQRAGFYCHTQAHHLGGFLYAYTKDLSQALSLADRKCGGSMYHGIVETYFLTEVVFEGANVEEVEIVDLCDQVLDDSKSMIYLECVHGIGHGLAKSYDYDVFSAVKRCDEFETEDEQGFCYQGIFMENGVEYLETEGGDYDENDLLYPCNKLELKYASACYYYHTTYLLNKTKSVKEAFQLCDGLDGEKQIQNCYLGIGRQFSILSNDIKVLSQYCDLGDPKYQSLCFVGVVVVVADQHGLDKAFETCQTFPEKFKTNCYLFMGTWISKLNLTPEQINDECKKAGDVEDYKACLKFAFNDSQ